MSLEPEIKRVYTSLVRTLELCFDILVLLIVKGFCFLKPIEGFGVSEVVDSDNPNFKPGDLVSGITGWEEYSLIHRTEQLRKIKQDDIPLSFHLGLLGMSFSIVFPCNLCSSLGHRPGRVLDLRRRLPTRIGMKVG